MGRTRSVTAILTGLVLALSVASVGAAPTRVEKASYVGGTPPGLALKWALADKGVGGVVLPGGSERFVSVVVEDDMGLPTNISITQDTTGDGVPEEAVDACGETTRPIPIKPHVDVVVYIFQEPCNLPTPSGLASSGTVTATFTRGRAR